MPCVVMMNGVFRGEGTDAMCSDDEWSVSRLGNAMCSDDEWSVSRLGNRVFRR